MVINQDSNTLDRLMVKSQA